MPSFTSDQIPGSLSVTRNPADSASKQSTSGRCPRCERMHHEQPCAGVQGELHPLGS